jgi:4-amino-4-deoxychorismate lyase
VSLQATHWLDGLKISALPLPDRGINFGDGLFETVLVKGRCPLYRELHLARLARGLHALGMPDCIAAARRHIENAAIAIDANCDWSYMRVTVIRGSTARGYAPAPDSIPEILITTAPMLRDCTQMLAPAELAVADIRLASQPALALIKHLNRLEQILAAAQSHREGKDECIVLDQADHLTCVIAGNFFLVRNGTLVTPLLENCGVAGTRRSLIIDKWAPDLVMEVRETRLSLADLEDAEEVFYSNSLLPVRPVLTVGHRRWTRFEVCGALFQRYLEDMSC